MRRLFDISDSILVDVLGSVVDNIKDWMIIGDECGKIVYVNDAVMRDCGPIQQEIIGQDMCLFVGVDLSDEITLSHIQEFLRQKEPFDFITTRFIKNNERIYLANQLFMVQGKKGDHYCVCISKDITSTQRLKEEIYKANYFDSLTNYPNYKIFLESLSRQIYKSKKQQSQFAIIFVDIRGLGQINNLYNITMGDFVIKEIGQRIKEVSDTRKEIFKYKGNVFAIIFQDFEEISQIEAYIKAIHKKVDEKLHIQNRELTVELNSGIVVYPQNGLSSSQLIERIQVALFSAKKKRAGEYVFYSKEVQDMADMELRIENDLQEAVKQDEFIVYYQPFVDLREDRLVGMEALVRRKKKNGELIMPGQFIEQLEQLNLIEKVGMGVLEKVCQQLRQWLDKGYHIVPVSVNLSALQFKNPLLVDEIEKILERYDINPEYIVLEITESTVMEDINIAKSSIEKLKSKGFSISIDDFGTGYASIGYLKKFMFDHLKIDISFIREIVVNEEDRSIVEAIIAIAKTLNLKTIAEGIENEEQLDVMNKLGCEMGQGFFWDRPIAAENIESKYFLSQL